MSMSNDFFSCFNLGFQEIHSERFDSEAAVALRADTHQFFLNPLEPERSRRRKQARPERVSGELDDCG